uniref:Uncharacterized protein n=1 Tax=Mycena chlorophos TaxID=658473 RepID=A0ABQ0L297_MYCCL|nr:predicted protein [Mycena chlorophos]
MDCSRPANLGAIRPLVAERSNPFSDARNRQSMRRSEPKTSIPHIQRQHRSQALVASRAVTMGAPAVVHSPSRSLHLLLWLARMRATSYLPTKREKNLPHQVGVDRRRRSSCSPTSAAKDYRADSVANGKQDSLLVFSFTRPVFNVDWSISPSTGFGLMSADAANLPAKFQHRSQANRPRDPPFVSIPVAEAGIVLDSDGTFCSGTRRENIFRAPCARNSGMPLSSLYFPCLRSDPDSRTHRQALHQTFHQRIRGRVPEARRLVLRPQQGDEDRNVKNAHASCRDGQRIDDVSAQKNSPTHEAARGMKAKTIAYVVVEQLAWMCLSGAESGLDCGSSRAACSAIVGGVTGLWQRWWINAACGR